MMGVIAAIAGAIQIASWAMALLDAIEKPSVPTPTKARESRNHQPPQGDRYSYYTGRPLIKQGGTFMTNEKLEMMKDLLMASVLSLSHEEQVMLLNHIREMKEARNNEEATVTEFAAGSY